MHTVMVARTVMMTQAAIIEAWLFEVSAPVAPPGAVELESMAECRRAVRPGAPYKDTARVVLTVDVAAIAVGLAILTYLVWRLAALVGAATWQSWHRTWNMICWKCLSSPDLGSGGTG
jgi:hypothetical protein